jgi:hypothetical protein
VYQQNVRKRVRGELLRTGFITFGPRSPSI